MTPLSDAFLWSKKEASSGFPYLGNSSAMVCIITDVRDHHTCKLDILYNLGEHLKSRGRNHSPWSWVTPVTLLGDKMSRTNTNRSDLELRLKIKMEFDRSHLNSRCICFVVFACTVCEIHTCNKPVKTPEHPSVVYIGNYTVL